jgi:hypothetical protein
VDRVAILRRETRAADVLAVKSTIYAVRIMRDAFKGFLVLRFMAFVALLIVLAAVLGIRSLARGSELAGVAILAGVVVAAAALGSIVARRIQGRPR